MLSSTSGLPLSSSYHNLSSQNNGSNPTLIQETRPRKWRENNGDCEKKFSEQIRSEKIRNTHRSRDRLEQPAKRKSRSLPRAPKEEHEHGSKRQPKDEERPKKHYREEGRHYSRIEDGTHLRSSRNQLNPRNHKGQTLKSVLSKSMHLLVVPREVEVPVVVDEVTKWIAGVSNVTTCSDIIDAILTKQNKKAKVEDYVLCERWKRVDRPLKAGSRILSIWEGWGEDRTSVKFVLKRIRVSRNPVIRKDSKLWRKQQSGTNSDTRHPSSLTRPKKEKRKHADPVQDIIGKILNQQNSLREQLKRLEQQEKQENKRKLEKQEDPGKNEKGKNYIMKTFLSTMEQGDELYSHDSGIGSAMVTHTDSEYKSMDYLADLAEDDVEKDEDEEEEDIEELLKVLESIVSLNAQIQAREEELIDIEANIKKQEVDEGSEEKKRLETDLENMVQINSRLSYDIKRNDFSLSHMVKNYEGRRTFLRTIEIDINRAESYGKKLQKEFEREYETLETCNSILSVPEDEVEDDITLELVNHNNTSSMQQKQQQQQQQQQQQVQVQPQKEDHSSLSLKRHASIKDLDKIDEHFKLEDDSGVGLEQNDLENEFQVSATNLPFGQLILDLIDHSEDLDTEREDHNADHDSETEDHLGESSS